MSVVVWTPMSLMMSADSRSSRADSSTSRVSAAISLMLAEKVLAGARDGLAHAREKAIRPKTKTVVGEPGFACGFFLGGQCLLVLLFIFRFFVVAGE